MKVTTPKYKIHFINEKTDGIIAIKTTVGVPRVGEEIRLDQFLFFKVVLVVWVYDEPECPCQRINIGVKRIELDEAT